MKLLRRTLVNFTDPRLARTPSGSPLDAILRRSLRSSVSSDSLASLKRVSCSADQHLSGPVEVFLHDNISRWNSREYHVFSYCTEVNAERIGCFWPNPVVEHFIIGVHKHFFSNCSRGGEGYMDPPDDTLTLLILIPVFLTLAMVALVVWCSKRSDILA
ncbi:receptor activity-modifying 3-like isoform X1 [Labeo rohita]|uniref:Receptor activity-modifying protein 3 n=1 Tax=Labeo rohita TaxID=84645 RepID=A0A498M4U4_LABRO|nr:receptor activity-modifying 3-like isoform X1 [Labeo rohita]